MQIHRVRGSNLKDALVRARRAHGEDALVISQESVPGGVALAVARTGAVRGDAGETPARTPSPGARTRPIDIGDIGGNAAARVPAPSPLLAELARRLERHGASARFAHEIEDAVRARAGGERHVFDLAADAIAGRFPPVRLTRLDRRTRVLAFAGAAGAGKTTAIVKLARRMKQAGRRVEIATLDARRTGAVEAMRAWSRELELPLTVLRPGVRIQPGAFESSDVDLVLLDTAGRPAAERPELERQARVFRAAGATFDVCVVLPASASADALARTSAELAPLAPAAAVITKLDETRAPAAALEAALALSARVAFLCDGPDVERDLARADGERIADLFLRGRLA